MVERIRGDIPVCAWPDGWQGNLRHAVIDNIITNQSGTHMLLVWRAEAEIQGGRWALVGGYIDPGDTAVGTVKKETWQEAAVRVGAAALFRIVDNPNRRNEEAGDISFVFASTVPDQHTYGRYSVADTDGGVTHAQWFPLDQLPPAQDWAFDHHEIVTAWRQNPTTYPPEIFLSGAES